MKVAILVTQNALQIAELIMVLNRCTWKPKFGFKRLQINNKSSFRFFFMLIIGNFYLNGIYGCFFSAASFSCFWNLLHKKYTYQLPIENCYHNFSLILQYILQNGSTHNLSLEVVRKFWLAHGLFTFLTFSTLFRTFMDFHTFFIFPDFVQTLHLAFLV